MNAFQATMLSGKGRRDFRAPFRRSLILALLFTAVLAPKGLLGEKGDVEPRFSKAVRIKATGEINSLFRYGLEQRVAQAKALDADLVILEIDSPGGTVVDSRALANLMRQIDWAR
ncbi:MAG: hypothetical protein N2C14_12160, partial [Planctomycetales bacterium]